jgi:hypothetical protein
MTPVEEVNEALAGYRGLDPIQMVLVPSRIWRAFCEEINQQPDAGAGVTQDGIRFEEAAAKDVVTIIRG